jgi:hypothetical protein
MAYVCHISFAYINAVARLSRKPECTAEQQRRVTKDICHITKWPSMQEANQQQRAVKWRKEGVWSHNTTEHGVTHRSWIDKTRFNITLQTASTSPQVGFKISQKYICAFLSCRKCAKWPASQHVLLIQPFNWWSEQIMKSFVTTFPLV